MEPSVVALPGGVNPAAVRYAPLLSALGGEVDLHLKDLEVYAGEEPPADYSIAAEAGGLDERSRRLDDLIGGSTWAPTCSEAGGEFETGGNWGISLRS